MSVKVNNRHGKYRYFYQFQSSDGDMVTMRKTHAVIYDIKKYAIHDGPGIRTTVFFKGCPLSCLWCHNPEGMTTGQQILYSPKRCVGCRECLEVCPQGALSPTPQGIKTDDALCRGCGTCCEQCPALAREAVARFETVEALLAIIEKDMAFYEASHGGVTFTVWPWQLYKTCKFSITRGAKAFLTL